MRIIASPSEPEESNWEEYCADHHGQQPLFWNRDAVVLFQLSVVARFKEYNDCAPDQDTNNQPDVRKCRNGWIDVSVLREDDGVGFQEEVEYSIDECCINCDKEDNWLEE